MGNDQGFPVQGAMGGRAGGRQVMGWIVQLSRVESTSAPITARLKPPDRVRCTRERCAREASPSCGYGRADQQVQRLPRGVPTRPDHAIFVRTGLFSDCRKVEPSSRNFRGQRASKKKEGMSQRFNLVLAPRVVPDVVPRWSAKAACARLAAAAVRVAAGPRPARCGRGIREGPLRGCHCGGTAGAGPPARSTPGTRA